ncbi:MAG: ArsR/SmtB family transcription factor [Halobacteriales archaeon]
MAEKEWAPSDVFDVFGDALARRILVLASERALSADELADQFEASRPTIYRRLNALIDYDLLREQQEIDTDGNHYQVYETTLKRVSFEIEGGGYTIDMTMRQSLAEQFESFWTGLEESPDGKSHLAEQLDERESGGIDG